MTSSLRLALVGAFACLALPLRAAEPVWFNTLIANWTDYGTPEYLDFVGEARPEICQVGFYGVTFYSVAHTPFGKGYPAHFPVQGTKECGEFFRNLNKEVHARGSKVVGHFNTTFILGDPDKRAGFFDWYHNGWDAKALGPKPTVNPTEMLAVDAAGKLITTSSYKIGGWPEYHGCLNNPLWRKCLKAMMTDAIARGVDGLIANYYYRRDCMCPHCVGGFRAWLGTNYTAAQLNQQFAIADLKAHEFKEIPSWHNPKETSPYKLAALKWTQLSLKDAFDDVFIAHGRQLKPDLLVAQWNHLSAFTQISGDERCLLPGGVWGRGENYLWYSTGNAASQTDLANGDLGDGTLQLRYVRGAFGPRPFVLGKYEQSRTRATIAEGIANGGAGLGFYANFKNPAGREAMTTYFGFARKHRDLYLGAQSAAELLLLYPRSAVHRGDVEPVARFKAIGHQLALAGYAFDIVPDDIVTGAQIASRRVVVATSVGRADLRSASSADRDQQGRTQRGPTTLSVDAMPADDLVAKWRKELVAVTRREGATTVVTSVLSQPKRRLVHLVNYNREEPPKTRTMGSGPHEEKPIAVEGITVRLALQLDERVKSIRLLSPDAEVSTGPAGLVQRAGEAAFTVPRMLIYTVAVVELE
ncbi:MAG: hypothetical protein EB141_07540 [Verrucomicrobia bacterium]|nr:hypothetical protein [Verrucomicrobiota bacterium]NBU10312.1 hypothetical protein [Pseudomonadota bacterium]NDA66489.1 hypothetical protein [Verrucomicrobiota bacterium]NDB75481.1 hypothetical protein [Verrucomicrobiota bacterium]NDD38421.1 hypothetical protein [Verrucomicrobiota bacterium]